MQNKDPLDKLPISTEKFTEMEVRKAINQGSQEQQVTQHGWNQC